MYPMSIFAIYLFFHFLQVLFCLHGKNVCDDIFRGYLVKMCCSDYEEYVNKCVPCHTGFTSEIGENCRPCTHGTYGPKCAGICACNVSQRCDNVVGCFSELIEFGSEGNDEKNMSTIQKIEPKVTNEGKSEIANTTYYYIITIMTLIFVCFVCFMLFKYKQTSKNKNVSQRRSCHSYAEVDEAAFNEIVDVDFVSNGSYLEMASSGNTSKTGYYNENQMLKCESSFDESTISMYDEDKTDSNLKTKYENLVDTAQNSDELENITSTLKCADHASSFLSTKLNHKQDWGLAVYEEPV